MADDTTREALEQEAKGSSAEVSAVVSGLGLQPWNSSWQAEPPGQEHQDEVPGGNQSFCPGHQGI